MLTPAIRADLGQPGEGRPVFRELVRRMGADGWLGLGWPVEYGGQGRPASDQFIMMSEVVRAGAPFPFVTVNTVGPAIMAHGTDEQKQKFLPGILRGEINFAIGYTEPEAGTDLASLRTRADRDGDEWVIDGNKVYTSSANQADYVWLACRTDPSLPRHRGISILIVPTDAPGFSWTPIVTVGGEVTTATFYDGVRVPMDHLVGGVNGGWRVITMQLNHERVGLAALSGLAEKHCEDVIEWCRTTPSGGAGGERMIDLAWVRADLARCAAIVEAVRLMNWRLAGEGAGSSLDKALASAVKVFGTERAVEVYRLLQGILGPVAHLRTDSSGAVLRGELERASRAAQINTFGGGVNEVQRDIIANAALGVPRTKRA